MNGFADDPCWPNVPENDSVVVETAAGAVGVVVVVELHPTANRLRHAKQATIEGAMELARGMESNVKQESCHRSRNRNPPI